MNNVFERMTPRSIRITYTIVTLIVLSVTLIHAFDVMVFRATSNDQCGWLVRKDGKPGLIITDVVPGGVTDRAGVRNARAKSIHRKISICFRPLRARQQ